MAVGARLRAAREGRHLTLKAIAESTKISSLTLEAIEAGAWSRVPGGIFTRAYVRTFAREVGLDPEEAVRQFLAEVPAANEEVPFRLEEAKVGGRSWATVGAWAVALAVLAIGGAAAWPSATKGWPVGGVRTVVAVAPEVRSAAVVPARDTAAPEATAPEATAPQAAAVLPITGEIAVATGPDAAAPLPITGETGAIAAPTETVAAPAGAPAEPAGIQMVIAPRADCWVKVSVDGAQGFARLLRAGERQALEAASRVIIHVGNAGAFDYTLNGEPGRPLGREGQVVTARIDLETMHDFVAR